MELPQDPNNLLQAIYNAQGIRQLPEKDDLAYSYTFNALDTYKQPEPDYKRPVMPNFYNNIEEFSRQESNQSVTMNRTQSIWDPLQGE
jgi:hypothetical protein